MSEFSDVVNDNTGCTLGEYAIKIVEAVSPVVNPSRLIPVPIQEKVKNELRMLAE